MNNIDLNNNNNNTSEDERLKSVSFDLGTKNNLVESILQNNKENCKLYDITIAKFAK